MNKSPTTEKSVAISKAGLKKRGWTESLIARFLGRPDRTATNPHYSCAAPMQLYFLDRIESAECSPQFADAQKQSAKRSETLRKVAARKRDDLVSRLDGLSFAVPAIPQESLVARACANYNERKLSHGDCGELADEGSDPGFLERITVNYLRHCVTTYDAHVGSTFGKVGRAAGIRVVKHKVLEAIAVQYPWLADECERQRLRCEGM